MQTVRAPVAVPWQTVYLQPLNAASFVPPVTSQLMTLQQNVNSVPDGQMSQALHYNQSLMTQANVKFENL